MTNTDATPPRSEPILDEPAELVPSTMPADEPQPVEQVERDEPAPQPIDLGTPLGQLVAGGLLAAAAAAWMLYRLGGWPWVLIGLATLLALALAVVLAPLVWRRWRARNGGRPQQSRSGRAGAAARPWSPGRAARPAAAGARGRGGVRSALGQLAASRRASRSNTATGQSGKRAAAGKVRRMLGLTKRGTTGTRRSPSAPASAAARPPGRVRRAWHATRATASRAAGALRRGDRRLTATTEQAAHRALDAVRSRSRRLRERGRPVLRRLLRAARVWDERLTGGLAARAWSWWRRRRGEHTPASHPNGQADADPEPGTQQPAPTTSLPALSTHRATGPTIGGTSMSDFSLITHATELPTIAASYESDDMMDVRGHMQMLRELPLAAGTCVRIWTERLAADYPLNQDAAEALQRVYDAFGAAVEACDEASVVFETSHDADIQRHLTPRTNEQKWNHRSR